MSESDPVAPEALIAMAVAGGLFLAALLRRRARRRDRDPDGGRDRRSGTQPAQPGDDARSGLRPGAQIGPRTGRRRSTMREIETGDGDD